MVCSFSLRAVKRQFTKEKNENLWQLKTILHSIISLRVEVSLFVVSLEIEDRDAVEVATGRSTKRPSTLNDIILFYLQADNKKKSDMNSLIYFSFAAVTLKLQSSNLQFSNFKALVISTSLVIGTCRSDITYNNNLYSRELRNYHSGTG
jgi:hypothetical protein